LRLMVKIVNIFSGVLVAGHWGFTMTEWALSVAKKRRRQSEGFLGRRPHENED
jgi:endoplasmic reticulum-Golgi intermediate compartment protein 2